MQCCTKSLCTVSLPTTSLKYIHDFFFICCTLVSLTFMTVYVSLLSCTSLLGLGKRVSKDQDNRITTEEHFWDVSVLVHRLRLLLSLPCTGHFSPHLLNILKYHVAMPEIQYLVIFMGKAQQNALRPNILVLSDQKEGMLIIEACCSYYYSFWALHFGQVWFLGTSTMHCNCAWCKG